MSTTRSQLRTALLILAPLAGCLLSTAPTAAQVSFERIVASEQAVRSMPLERRPNRLGHFYGNNVRRVYYGRWFVNRGRYARPVTRFFYVP